MSGQGDKGAIEFWFDFSSPYAYFSALRVDALAFRHGREVLWRPFMLGAAFRQTGMAPLTQQPLRGAYALHDWERMARRMGVPFVLPAGFPMIALAASRIFYWLETRDMGMARAFGRRIFHAYFGEGRDMTRAEDAAAEAVAAGADAAQALAAANDPRWKEHFKEISTQATARGIFGSPFFIVDGEPFWGNDRLDEIERWLELGGW